MSKEDWQKRINSGEVLGFDHLVQQYPAGSGCYACYRKSEGHRARQKDWSHDHRTCEVCQSLVKAKQQTSKRRLRQLARVLDAGQKGVCAVELTNMQREKEKEMLKIPPKWTTNKGKGKDDDKDNRGGRRPPSRGGIAPMHAQPVQRGLTGRWSSPPVFPKCSGMMSPSTRGNKKRLSSPRPCPSFSAKTLPWNSTKFNTQREAPKFFSHSP